MTDWTISFDLAEESAEVSGKYPRLASPAGQPRHYVRSFEREGASKLAHRARFTKSRRARSYNGLHRRNNDRAA